MDSTKGSRPVIWTVGNGFFWMQANKRAWRDQKIRRGNRLWSEPWQNNYSGRLPSFLTLWSATAPSGTYRDKPSVVRVIGALNRHYRETGANVMLLVPGRIGTASPELGVPVSFAEIDQMRMIFEIAYSEAGYQPELSWGSHFFQDLVESEIFYGAIPEEALGANASAPKNGKSVCRTGFFTEAQNLFPRLEPDSGLLPGLVSVYEPGDLVFSSDVMNGSCLCVRGKSTERAWVKSDMNM